MSRAGADPGREGGGVFRNYPPTAQNKHLDPPMVMYGGFPVMYGHVGSSEISQLSKQEVKEVD